MSLSFLHNTDPIWTETIHRKKRKPHLHLLHHPKGKVEQRLVEKEAEKARRRAAKDEDDAYDSDEVLDPREKARRDQERQLHADMNNAAELFGAAALGGMSRVLNIIVSDP
jgi:hypothetical protein